MAKVGAIIKVMPSGADVDLDKLEGEIKNKVNPEKIERKPIAFGLNALIVNVVMDEKAGGTDPVESELRNIDGVGEVSIEHISRLVD